LNKKGIWLDKEKAHIVSLTGEQEELETIYSGLEFFRPRGGSGTRATQGGPQDVVQDSKFLEREKNQLKTYFNTLADAIGDADAIALFGPAATNKKFARELHKSHKALAARLKTVTKTDSMTENQFKALVRDYFRPKS